jgi:hypothetical protein
MVQTVWRRSALFLLIMMFAMRRQDWRQMVEAPKPHIQIVRRICPLKA